MLWIAQGRGPTLLMISTCRVRIMATICEQAMCINGTILSFEAETIQDSPYEHFQVFEHLWVFPTQQTKCVIEFIIYISSLPCTPRHDGPNQWSTSRSIKRFQTSSGMSKRSCKRIEKAASAAAIAAMAFSSPPAMCWLSWLTASSQSAWTKRLRASWSASWINDGVGSNFTAGDSLALHRFQALCFSQATRARSISPTESLLRTFAALNALGYQNPTLVNIKIAGKWLFIWLNI